MPAHDYTLDDAYDYAADVVNRKVEQFYMSLPVELRQFATPPEDLLYFAVRPDLWTDSAVKDLFFAYMGVEVE